MMEVYWGMHHVCHGEEREREQMMGVVLKFVITTLRNRDSGPTLTTGPELLPFSAFKFFRSTSFILVQVRTSGMLLLHLFCHDEDK
jgi:hypothetical protein